MERAGRRSDALVNGTNQSLRDDRGVRSRGIGNGTCTTRRRCRSLQSSGTRSSSVEYRKAYIRAKVVVMQIEVLRSRVLQLNPRGAGSGGSTFPETHRANR